MIPVEGQYEQACNAIDGEISGAGKKLMAFDISLLLDVIDNYKSNQKFKQWVNQAEAYFYRRAHQFLNS
jgi:hypothetical protein